MAQPGDPIAQYLRGQLDEMRALAEARSASAAASASSLRKLAPAALRAHRTNGALRAPFFMAGWCHGSPAGNFVQNLTADAGFSDAFVHN